MTKFKQNLPLYITLALFSVAVAIFGVVGARTAIRNIPLAAIGDNLLLNPGFEGAFIERGAGEIKVAAGWEPWWLPGTRPEYKDAAPHQDRIHSGDHAQQFFTTDAVHTAGIYQRVDVPVGSTLTFSAWVHAWSQFRDGRQGRYRMKIGIDVYGGTDPENTDILWSGNGNAIQPYDGYTKLSVETLARSDRATVFVWGQNEWPCRNNDGYVDDTSLVAVSAEPPPPPPEGLTEAEVAAIARRVAVELLHEMVNGLE